ALATGADPYRAAETIDELEALYTRVPGAFPGGADDIPFYRDRVRLAEQMQRLARSGLFGSPTAVSDISWIQRMSSEWEELVVRYEPEDGAEAPAALFSPEERAGYIRNDIRRNATAALALLTLRRVALTHERDAATVARYDGAGRATRRAAGEYGWPYQSWTAAANHARTSMEAYEVAVRRRTPAWHWLAAAVGAGALGYAAWTSDAIERERAAIDEQIENEYAPATDLGAIRDARASIDEDIERLNFYETVRPIAFATGGTLIATAVIGRMLSVTRPRRVWRRYRRDTLVERWTAAGLEYEAALRDGDSTGVLVVGNDETFRLEGEVYTTPHFLPAEAGSAIEIEHITARRNGPDTIPVVVDTDLSLVYLGVVR
ncbi:MAG: hypothetical protein MI724_19010, partial [Spirochaetales bacterium]|nr:hypothetical protein [Spirochaetales bacterium]